MRVLKTLWFHKLSVFCSFNLIAGIALAEIKENSGWLLMAAMVIIIGGLLIAEWEEK